MLKEIHLVDECEQLLGVCGSPQTQNATHTLNRCVWRELLLFIYKMNNDNNSNSNTSSQTHTFLQTYQS